MPEVVTVAQAQLADVVRQLQILRFLLLGIAASLPVRREAEPEEGQDVAARIRADVECALADSIAPAIQNLERAARYVAAALEEG